MKLPGALNLLPPGMLPAWGVIAALILVVSVLAVLSALTGGDPGTHWRGALLMLQLSATLPLPLALVSALVEARRLTLGRVAPRKALWADLRGSRLALLTGWLLIGAADTALVWLHAGTAWPPAAVLLPAAVASLALALMVMQGAAWHGLARALWLVAPLAVVALGAGYGWAELWTHLQALGPWWHLALLCSLPLAWRWLELRLSAPLRIVAGPQPLTPRRRLAAATVAITERWRYVDARSQGMVAAIWLPQVLANNAFFGQNSFWSTPWGGGINAWYLPRLMLLALLATLLLRSSQMHWRWLLAPTGAFRRRLGQRIVVATLGLLLAIVVLIVAIAALILLVTGHFNGGKAWDMALHQGLPLALDILLAVTLATWVRGRVPSLVVAGLVYLGLAAAWLMLLWVLGFTLQAFEAPALWQRDATHAIASLLLAALFTRLANRAWARADLGTLFREPHKPADAF